MAMTGFDQLVYECEQELWSAVESAMNVLGCTREVAEKSLVNAIEIEMEELRMKINGNTSNAYCTEDEREAAQWRARRNILNEYKSHDR